jgi:ABC-type uncharacterized transport system ATPase subunit
LIEVEGLSKIYRVAEKHPGLAGTLRHFIGANGANKTTTRLVDG